VILDEYHYGAWRENAKELFEAEDKKEVEFGRGEGIEDFDEGIMPITTDGYLYLSGTPFRAIASGEFIEEQIYNWTYSDEQRAKRDWKDPTIPTPRAAAHGAADLPTPGRDPRNRHAGRVQRVRPERLLLRRGHRRQGAFKYEDEVQKWLDLIRGAFLPTSVDNLKLGAQKPPMPFSDVRLLGVLSHTFWFLPSVAACHAMRNLLAKKQNRFYHDYKVIVAAGAPPASARRLCRRCWRRWTIRSRRRPSPCPAAS
jgi:hypothetical protein